MTYVTPSLLSALALAIALPSLASAQRAPAAAAPVAVEPTRAGTEGPAVTEPAAECLVAVQIPEGAITTEGQVSITQSRTVPLRRWTHVTVVRSAGARTAPPVADVVEALAALDRDGDGVLDDAELAPHVRGGNGVNVELALPAEACR